MGKLKKGMLVGIGLTLMAKDAVQKEAKKQLARYDLSDKDLEKLARKATVRGAILKTRLERTLEDVETGLHREAKSIAKKALKRGAKTAAKHAAKRVVRRTLRRRKK